jgi:PPOX class probable F420-dependent enzyme
MVSTSLPVVISDAVRQFLNEKRFAVLATIAADGTPHQTVMWYELRGDMIVMNTQIGRVKETHLRRDARASICVADGYRYVTISGAVSLDDDPQTAQSDIRMLAIRYHGEEEGNRQAAEQFSKQQRVSIYLPIQRLIASGIE